MGLGRLLLFLAPAFPFAPPGAAAGEWVFWRPSVEREWRAFPGVPVSRRECGAVRAGLSLSETPGASGCTPHPGLLLRMAFESLPSSATEAATSPGAGGGSQVPEALSSPRSRRVLSSRAVAPVSWGPPFSGLELVVLSAAVGTGFTDSALSSPVPPMVNVPCSEDSEGNINMTCWASGFYPWNITLTWRQDGESLSHDVQQSEVVLPDGNGTYKTWVTISIRQGEEQRLTCYLEHSGNHSTHPVPPGEPWGLVLDSQWTTNPHGLVIIAVVIVAAVIIRLCVRHCNKRTSPAEGPELVSLQVLDQHVVGTGDHRDAAQLGFQPLMSAPGPTGSTEGAETVQPGGCD
nr:MHC class I polypeptide-related sequence B [Aotus nancymaae]